MWYQSRIGGSVTPASVRIERRPEQPSVKAVSFVLIPPHCVQFRPISAKMLVPFFATAPNTCCWPSTRSF